MFQITHANLVDQLASAGLDSFDQEEVGVAIDLLLEAFDATEIITWIYFYDAELGGTPADLVGEGKVREVMQRVRRMVESRCS